MSSPSVVGTGLVALDVIFRGKSERPSRRCAGGTCGNVLAILSFLGWKAYPVARLAEDFARRILTHDLAQWQVDLRFVSIPPTRPTPIVVERILASVGEEPVHRFSLTCPCCGAWLPRYQAVRASSVQAVLEGVPRPEVFFFDRPSRAALDLAAEYTQAGSLIVFEPSANADPRLFDAAIDVADVVKYSDQRFAAVPATRSKKQRLEIQTLGARGLRYRIANGRRRGRWRRLGALPGGSVVDTAGAGDWCTAGLLTRLAGDARAGFERAAEADIEQALRFGQALASWSCCFEGARGGMYERSRDEFRREVDAILAGDPGKPIIETGAEQRRDEDEICPACHSHASLPRSARLSRRGRAAS